MVARVLFPDPRNVLRSRFRYSVMVLVLVLQQSGGGGGARSSSAQEAASTGGGDGDGADGLLFWSPRWQPTGLEGENYYFGVVPK